MFPRVFSAELINLGTQRCPGYQKLLPSFTRNERFYRETKFRY